MPVTPIPQDPPRTQEEAFSRAAIVGKAIREYEKLVYSLEGEERASLALDICDMQRYQNRLLAFADGPTGTPAWGTQLSIVLCF